MSKSNKARRLYREITDMGIVSTSFSGLAGDSLWVTESGTAYRLPDLSDLHLVNIIRKYKFFEKQIPLCLKFEVERRGSSI